MLIVTSLFPMTQHLTYYHITTKHTLSFSLSENYGYHHFITHVTSYIRCHLTIYIFPLNPKHISYNVQLSCICIM